MLVEFVVRRFAKVAFVAKRAEAKRFVDVACEVVEFVPVKFWNVDEAFTKRLESVERPAVAVSVPVKFAAEEIVCPLIRPEVSVPRFAVVANNVEANKFVEVACEVVAFTPVKFWRVDEPEVRMLVKVPTEVSEDVTTFAASVVPVSVPAGAVPVIFPVTFPVRFPVPFVKKRFVVLAVVETKFVAKILVEVA